MIIEDEDHAVARTPRFLTFYGGPKDGVTEFVEDIFVASGHGDPHDGLIHAWTWVKESFLPYKDWEPDQEDGWGLAGYDVVADMAFFAGMC